MKMLPVQLSLNPPLGLWGDMLWRCPPAPPSQLAELKTQLPPSLPSDPRLWSREDVAVFLRFCEREFDLPKVNHELFQMNGKALCLLNRADFGHRCPGAGDVLHNVLQMLMFESQMMQWHLPNSPVTPTSRYPLSPHSHPPTPTWPPIAPPESPFHNTTHMHHFMAPNSVTLSPPPSVDSQASSPPQNQEQNAANNSSATNGHNGNGGGSGGGASSVSSNSSSNSSLNSAALTINGGGSAFAVTNGVTSKSSNHSDSDEESYLESAAAAAANSLATRSNIVAAAAAAAAAQYNSNTSPPNTPILKDMQQSLSQQITNSFVNSWSQSQPQPPHNQQKLQLGSGAGGSVSAPTTPSYMQPVKREFFPENNEPNTNGRLLWDFLQQLLNDRDQKYSNLIAWKCRDTGVFKIVDPAGLAQLWGIQKNHLTMNYDKMSRALRYYYRVNILRKVQGERHCYQFLRNSAELKNIKNISLLRHSVPNTPPATSGNNNSNNNSNTITATQPSNNQTNGVGTNGVNNTQTSWSLPQQTNMNGSSAQQSPQRPSSRSNHILPAISSSAAAAAVAAAAAYGPPPTSPLFMHAITGAFHYLSNSGPPPNSPALPSTPTEKFQFSALTLENNNTQESNEDMKPTDLSVGSNVDKRPYSSPPTANEDCYPLIRNADGLTTIKLIRYNESENSKQQSQSQLSAADHYATNASPKHNQQDTTIKEELNTSTAMIVDSDSKNVDVTTGHYNSISNMLPTDLRK